jgi:hypothetical protein
MQNAAPTAACLDAATARPSTGRDLTLAVLPGRGPRWPAVHATSVRHAGTRNGDNMADQWVRLGMAIVIIALVSLGLYQFGGRASAVEPSFHGFAFRP